MADEVKSEVDRYEPALNHLTGTPGMVPCQSKPCVNDYVRYSDYAALNAELAAAKQRIAELEAKNRTEVVMERDV